MLPRAPAEAGEVDGAERFEELNAEGFTFTAEMVVWTEGLILNELKWEMNVVTPTLQAEYTQGQTVTIRI